MSYEDDIRREEARKRLEARQRRREAAGGGQASARSRRSNADGSADADRFTSSRRRTSNRSPEDRQTADYADETYERRGRSTRATQAERSERPRRQSSSDDRARRRSSTSATNSSTRGARRASERDWGGTSGADGGIASRISGVLGTVGHAIGSAASAAVEGYRGLVARFGWKALAVTAAVVLLVLFLVVSGIRGCVGASQQGASTGSSATAASATSSRTSASSGSTGTASSSTSSASSSNTHASTGTIMTPNEAIIAARPEIDQTEIDEEGLKDILGDDLAEQLLAQTKTNNDAHWIAAHPDEYLEDGTIVRYKLLRLAAMEPQSVPFVREWPEKYCADDPDYTESHTDEASNGVPRLYQWDKRWGYTEYSSTTFALTGCAPTSLAMVYQAKTGDKTKTPYDMGVYANDNGYATEFDGTDGSLFSVGASGLGLTCTELGIDSGALQQALSDGQVVVVNVGPGDFTDSGHYFVATGLADDGTVVINDPFSATRSSKTWDIDTIINQTRALYAF